MTCRAERLLYRANPRGFSVPGTGGTWVAAWSQQVLATAEGYLRELRAMSGVQVPGLRACVVVWRVDSIWALVWWQEIGRDCSARKKLSPCSQGRTGDAVGPVEALRGQG